MPMTLIKGVFRILNTSPDGDSVRFYANHPDYWEHLPRRVRRQPGGSVQVRLVGIDTLETHYEPQQGNLGVLHQPIAWAHSAAAELLEFLGFERVVRQPDGEVIESTPEEVPGYLLSHTSDGNGRCVAFVFPGEIDIEDGKTVRVHRDWIQESANVYLLQTGLAYPGFFSDLYPELRQEMASAVEKAREHQMGVWQVDQTNIGFELKDLRTLTRDVVIAPKLFRRCIDYLAQNEGRNSLKQLKYYLKGCGERVLIEPEHRIVDFDSVIEVQGQTVKLMVPPETLVSLE